MSDEDTAMTTTGHDWSRADAITDDEVRAAALNDPDAQPLTEARPAPMRPVPRTKAIHRALGLTPEVFAAPCHIPLGTLRYWEQGRTEPDQTARAFLAVVALDPSSVSRSLETGHHP